MKISIDNRKPCCAEHEDLSWQGQNFTETPATSTSQATLSIDGMTCNGCALKIQTALQNISGVQNAQVILPQSLARVSYDADKTHIDEMLSVLQAVGYRAQPGVPHTAAHSAGSLKGPILWGAAAALAVVAFYLGLITLTSDWSYAVYQFGEYGAWVITLAVGLSLQVGLFARMRSAMAAAQTKGAGKGIAASGSMSGVAMALCCSHYLATLLPAIGLPFLSGAVAGLSQYQTVFFMIGVVFNILGLTYLVRLMVKNGMVSFGAAYR